MEIESRTKKSLKNAQIAILFYVVNLGLNFFSRKIFLDYLGAEVLGLNTTAQNLLGFLNLAELGVGTAVAYTLYKPLFERDVCAVNEIVTVQAWLYRKIAWVVCVGACLLMLFFPWLFDKMALPLWYAYASFGVLLFAALLGYFVNYKQIVLSADQKEYKVTFCVQGTKATKVFLQLLAIRFLPNGYVYWLALEAAMSIVGAVLLDRTVRHEYPWLRTEIRLGRELKRKYPAIVTKTKQLFFHKFSLFVLGQTTPLIIYAYTSLTLVAVYGNYMLIVSGLVLLMTALLNGITAGVGNLVAEGNKDKIKGVFWELTSFRVWMAAVICFCFYVLADSFVALWVGDGYLLPRNAFVVLVVYAYISLTRTNDAFISAYGLYQDIGAPLIEAGLNIGGAILLGYHWGLAGILLGSVISMLVVVYFWKPYFLYRNGFKESVWEYFIKQLKFLMLIGISWCVGLYIRNITLGEFQVENFGRWFEYAFLLLAVFSAVSFILFWATEKGMRRFVARLWNFCIRR